MSHLSSLDSFPRQPKARVQNISRRRLTPRELNQCSRQNAQIPQTPNTKHVIPLTFLAFVHIRSATTQHRRTFFRHSFGSESGQHFVPSIVYAWAVGRLAAVEHGWSTRSWRVQHHGGHSCPPIHNSGGRTACQDRRWHIIPGRRIACCGSSAQAESAGYTACYQGCG
jgi:hypothetical protein